MAEVEGRGSLGHPLGAVRFNPDFRFVSEKEMLEILAGYGFRRSDSWARKLRMTPHGPPYVNHGQYVLYRHHEDHAASPIVQWLFESFAASKEQAVCRSASASSRDFVDGTVDAKSLQ